jgi:deazaflavin-dependent oxidoreductase (nitroreductase family)
VQDRTAKLLSRLHVAAHRTTRGRLGSRLVDNDMLLLHTVGRHTRRHHTVPLLYLRADGGLVVFASWGGRDTHPHWYLNLVAAGGAEVTVGPRRFGVTSRVAEGDEHHRLWGRAVAAYAPYATYQERTERVIPVVVLEPVL